MKNIRIFISKNFQFLVMINFSIYLNKLVFVMCRKLSIVKVHEPPVVNINVFTRFYQISYMHYENTPIQICRKFHLQTLKISR